MISYSFLIPTHNRETLLRQTFRSLAEIEIPADTRVELVVVANNCSDQTVATVRELAPSMPFPTRVVEEPEPGLNPARNRAVREASGDVAALLDDDVWVHRDWLKSLNELYRDHHADIAGGPVELWWEAVQRPEWFPASAEGLLSRFHAGDSIKQLPFPQLIGANFSFLRKWFDEVGGFRKGLDRVGKQLMAAGETDFMGRLMARGAKLYYHPGAEVKHWVSPERVTWPYLTGVTRGNARSRILMKDAFGPAVFARCLAGHAYLGAKGTAGEIVGLLTGNKTARFENAMLRITGTAGVGAAFRRLLKGPLQRAAKPS